MKRFGTLFIMVIMICFSNTAIAAVKIKLGVVTKPGSAQNIVAEKFQELIEKRSKNNKPSLILADVKLRHARNDRRLKPRTSKE